MSRPKAPATVRPRIRVTRGSTIILGPGKADLLEAIRDTGSIRAAATRLEMSYMRAWSLVRTMNASFREPVIARARGGAGRGGTTLTRLGERILALYREMDRRATRSIASAWKEIARELK